MCNECMKECIGTTPCQSCVVLAEARENKLSWGDVFTAVAVIVVCYLWAIAG